ncbi:hypothetical protein Hanom_Chr03g00261911 [Helianthus anomalus]
MLVCQTTITEVQVCMRQVVHHNHWLVVVCIICISQALYKPALDNRLPFNQ